MVTLPIAALIARDLTRQQFAGPAVRPGASPLKPPRHAVLRRRGARALRSLADRLEPAPSCPQET